MNEIFQRSISLLPFSSVRIPKSLVHGGVITIEQLVQKNPWEIFSRDYRQIEKNTIKGLGKSSLEEIIRVLADKGLKLSMTKFEMEQYK